MSTATGGKATLTKREQEVAAAMAAGSTNHGIAVQLGISTETVKEHVRNVFRKLGVNNRSSVTAWFIKGQFRTAITDYMAVLKDEGRMRLDYPAGSVGAEEAWRDYSLRKAEARERLQDLIKE